MLWIVKFVTNPSALQLPYPNEIPQTMLINCFSYACFLFHRFTWKRQHSERFSWMCDLNSSRSTRGNEASKLIRRYLQIFLHSPHFMGMQIDIHWSSVPPFRSLCTEIRDIKDSVDRSSVLPSKPQYMATKKTKRRWNHLIGQEENSLGRLQIFNLARCPTSRSHSRYKSPLPCPPLTKDVRHPKHGALQNTEWFVFIR